MKNATKKTIAILLFFLSGIMMFCVVVPVNADQTLWDMQRGELDEVGRAYNQHQDQPTDIRLITINVIKIFLSLLAIIFVIYIMWGGFRWMTAGANEDRVKSAKHQIKSAIFGTSLTIPISHGRLNLGTWQGIYLGEFRDHGGSRRVVLTIQG